MQQRDDWIYGEEFEKFVSNLDKTSISLRPFVLMLTMVIDNSPSQQTR